VPSLRTLLISRARVDIPGARYLELDDLDPAAARRYLTEYGVTDEAQIAAALEVARGNPLSLRLAADALLRIGTAGLTDLIQQRDALQHELVQGQLYRRILQHLHRLDVRQLAHPGLVVRRMTPEIIKDVLAVPCGLGPLGDEQARELFECLGREVSFVRFADDGAIEHRPDVRRVMLRLLYLDRPQVAREIHERAAAYHAARSDEVSVAEEAYHRFALGETGGPWLDRLTPAAATRLRGALEELPESCWPTLASYTGIDLPPERWAAATEADRERRLALRLADLLGHDRLEEAVARLEQQPPRHPTSPLWRWQGRAFALAGRLPEALEALRRAATTMLGPPGEAREDLRLAAELAARLGCDGGGEGGDRDNLVAQPRPPSSSPGAPRADFHWLDDSDLRQLIREAIDAGGRSSGEGPRRERSTRAAEIYARAVAFNHTRARSDGSIPLLEWIESLGDASRPTFARLKAALRDRATSPEGLR
jgi:hypothetical protein